MTDWYSTVLIPFQQVNEVKLDDMDTILFPNASVLIPFQQVNEVKSGFLDPLQDEDFHPRFRAPPLFRGDPRPAGNQPHPPF